MKLSSIRLYLILTILSCLSFLRVSGQADQPTLLFISNSHLDTQWNWDVRTTINEYVKNTMTQNFALLDKYPHFNFNYEAAIKYMWMKEYYPSDYERLKKYISSGRWNVSGCSVDASDVMVSSAESIMRNWLYANKFYQKEFGVRGGRDIMLPDCFGFSYALPSLAAHCGFRGFHTAKLGWGAKGYDEMPPYGIWQGVDGSQIYAIYKPHAYDSHEEYNKDMANDADMLSTIRNNYQRTGVAAEVRYVGPRSDHGGGLQDRADKDGENTPYWLNYSVTSQGPVKVVMATPDEVFDYLDLYRNSKYEVHNGELPMRTHGVGAYTSRTMLKLWNRRNELLADAAEKASALAHWLGLRSYPREELAEAWVRNLWQAHHDGITGTSIPNAYYFSMNDYVSANKSFAAQLAQASAAVIAKMDTQVEGTPVIVYNPLSWQRTDIVEATLPVTANPESLRVLDAEGKEVLAQINRYDAARGELHFIFAATVPSLGYAVYDVRLGEQSDLTSTLTVDETSRTLSNGNYRFSVSQTGDVQRLVDVQQGRTLLNNSQLQLIDDHEDAWPSWEISYTDVRRTATPVTGNVSITLAEDGPLRKSFRVERSQEGSTFVQYYRMNALNNRIDCVSEVDWQSRGRMLKANFQTAFTHSTDTYDLSLGTIERGIRTGDEYEVQGHQWADMTASNGSSGVSILNDCKYGWDKPTNTSLRLTLIHTPSTGDSYTHQGYQDLGVNLFTYAYLPHQGNWSEDTQQQASQLNQPLVAFTAAKHEGTLGRSVPFISVNSDKVSLKAVKQSEYSDELIVRLYEWSGRAQNDVRLTFPADIVSIREVDGLEQPVEASTMEYTFEGNTLSLNIGKYQPKTFAVTLAPAHDQTPSSATQQPVDLTAFYNIDMMSFDSKKNDASSTGLYAYPAEQVPDEVRCHDIAFLMGPKADGERNAVRAQAQTIELSPESGQKTLYLLMASINKHGTAAEVTVGDDTYLLDVPYFAGTLGQLGSPFNAGTRYRRQDVALTTTHSHVVSRNANEAYGFLYIYMYAIPLGENASKLVLPRDNNLLLFAASTGHSDIDDMQPLSELNTYIDYRELTADDDSRCGGYLAPRTVSASSYINSNEAPAMAADMNELTKWCVDGGASKTPFLEYRFDKPVEVCQWMVLNAGSEASGYITKSCKLQRYENRTWVDVDIVEDNSDNKILRGVEPFMTERVRLQILQGEQEGSTTRIYEFAVYGRVGDESSVASIEGLPAELTILGLDAHGQLRCRVPQGIGELTLHVLDLNGRQLLRKAYPVNGGEENLLSVPASAGKGVRLFVLTARRDGESMKSETRKNLLNSLY